MDWFYVSITLLFVALGPWILLKTGQFTIAVLKHMGFKP